MIIPSLLLLSIAVNIALFAFLYIAKEQRKVDLDIINSKNDAIQELFSVTQENDFEFTTPYDEFLSYLDEEGTL